MPLKPRSKEALHRAAADPHEVEPAHPIVDPWNVLLDEFEAQVRLLLDNGLAPQLRTRLDRLMPGVATSPPPPPDIETAPTTTRQGLDPMVLAGVLVICRQLERFKLTSDQHAAIANLKDWLLEQLPPAKRIAA